MTEESGFGSQARVAKNRNALGRTGGSPRLHMLHASTPVHTQLDSVSVLHTCCDIAGLRSQKSASRGHVCPHAARYDIRFAACPGRAIRYPRARKGSIHTIKSRTSISTPAPDLIRVRYAVSGVYLSGTGFCCEYVEALQMPAT
jgi:hypothetical protein